jgi:hypothetical protein
MSPAPTAPNPWTRLRGVLAPAAAVAALATFQDVAAQRVGPEMSHRGAPAGSEVELRMSGLPPSTAVLLGFGGVGSPHEILGHAVTDEAGVWSMSARIPEWAERNRTYLFFLAWADQRPWGFSEPLIVTGPDRAVRVNGEVEAVVEGCTFLRARDETLYALTGEFGRMEPGSEAVVVGTVLPDAGGSSPCAEGRPIRLLVREVRGG